VTTEILVGAMLNQLLYRKQSVTQSYVIPIDIQQYHYKSSTEKRLPRPEKLVEFLHTAIGRYDYVYVSIDGFDELLQDVKESLHFYIGLLEKANPTRIGFLYFKRDDGYRPRKVPFCDVCDRMSLVHYRCTHQDCDIAPWFDLCPACFEDNDLEQPHASHKALGLFKMAPRVVFVMPARVKEMRRFVESKIEKLVGLVRSFETR
jgi:hypothetical protein